jgi:hypothetical protein
MELKKKREREKKSWCFDANLQDNVRRNKKRLTATIENKRSVDGFNCL